MIFPTKEEIITVFCGFSVARVYVRRLQRFVCGSFRGLKLVLIWVPVSQGAGLN